MTYEYRVVQYRRWGTDQGRVWGEENGKRWPAETHMVTVLNELGAEGWEVTSNYGDEEARTVTLKRPKEEVLTQG